MTLSRAVGLVVAAVFLAGCSSTPTVSADDLADQVKSELTEQVGQEPASVECPEDLSGEVGETTTCVLTADDGVEIDVAVEVTEVDGSDVSFDIQVADQPNP